MKIFTNVVKGGGGSQERYLFTRVLEEVER